MSGHVEELLKRCTFKVTAGPDQGTAFAISRTLAVTCRHVVDGVPDAAGLFLDAPEGGRRRTATVLRRVPPAPGSDQPKGAARWPDLALLHVDDEDAFAQVVLLDAQPPESGSSVLVGGFPANAEVPYQSRWYGVGSAVNLDEAGNRYTLITGESVDPGLSGAPVLTEEGLVCGYVRVTRAVRTPLGGYFVPLAAVLSAAEELRAAHEIPGPLVRAWLESDASALVLKRHGRDHTGRRFDADEPVPAMLDLKLTDETAPEGVISSWTVSASSPEGLTGQLAVQDLGNGVLEAVDHWSRRHQLTSQSHVGLLGRVLLRGLLPAPIQEHLNGMDKQEPPLVRLCVSGSDSLTAIPWEYAEGLATSTEWVFGRYVPFEKPPVVRLDRASVLVVINPVDNLDPAVIAKTLMNGLGSSCRRISMTFRYSMNFSEFTAVARQGWDVIHYIGTGWSNGALGFPQEYFIDTPALEPIEWPTVTASLVAAGAKVVVLQMGTTRFEQEPTLTTFLDVLEQGSRGGNGLPNSSPDSDVRAVVLAQHVSTVDHVVKFSGPFYRALNDGASVERSVQQARSQMIVNVPAAPSSSKEKDYAAFGTISVATTMEGNIRLLKRDMGADESRQQPGGTPTQPGQASRPDTATPAPPASSWPEGSFVP